jgi:CotH kinase protein
MFKRLGTAFLAVLIVLTGLSVSQPAQSATTTLREGTDKASVLYDPLNFSKVEITKVSGGPDLTYDYLNSDTYRPANIKITVPGKAAVTIKNIGLRLKGQASRGDSKFPMKIKFDAFVKGQKFLGLKRMTLNNMVQDPSFIHEATAYKLYRAVGVPAPRTGYSRVFIQGTYFGLYLNIESIDKVFGKRWFPSTKHVYSGPYNCDIVPNNSCYEAGIGDTTRTDLTFWSRVVGRSRSTFQPTRNHQTDGHRCLHEQLGRLHRRREEQPLRPLR